MAELLSSSVFHNSSVLCSSTDFTPHPRPPETYLLLCTRCLDCVSPGLKVVLGFTVSLTVYCPMHSTALLYPSPYSPIPSVLIQPHSDRKSARCVQSVIFLQCGSYLAGTHFPVKNHQGTMSSWIFWIPRDLLWLITQCLVVCIVCS